MQVRRGWERLGQLPSRTVDALVSTAVALAVTLIINVAHEAGATRRPDALAYLLGLALAGLLLLRRDRPLLVLTGSVGLLLVYDGLGYPAFSPAVLLAVAAYSAAEAGRILPAAAITGSTVVVGVGWQTLAEDTSLAQVIGTDTIADAALLAAALLLGEAVRSRRAWAGEVRARLERAERDRGLEAERRVEQERLRIARELHDVVAHTIGVINVHAAVLVDLIDDPPEQVHASVRTIREQSREAIAELRTTVGLLRGGAADSPLTPAPRLAVVESLVELAQAAGLHIEVAVHGTVYPLSGSVDLTGYRIVQEALTNVIRHAQASTVTVAVHYSPDTIEILVTDDGCGAPAGTAHTGYGLTGMHERACALGGTLEAGPLPAGGFRVQACLPTDGGSS